jgi:hypothetical protein
MQDKAWPQHVAPMDGGAKRSMPLHLCAIGKLFPLDKVEDGRTRGHLFLFFSFIFFLFHLFTTNVTRALPLRTIKGEAGATSEGTPME